MRFISFVLVCFFTASCGEEEDPCLNQDYTVQGMCVITNDYPVSREDIEETVSLLENIVSIYTLPLPENFWEDHGTIIKFTKLEDRLRGARSHPYVYIDTKTIYTDGDGFMPYYILGHELLHIVSQWHMGASHKENSKHLVEDVFVEFGITHQNDARNTMEYDLYISLYDKWNE